MKLIACRECKDVFRLLINDERTWRCGKASGYDNENGLNAVIIGSSAVPMALENADLHAWFRAREPHCAPMIRAWYIVPGVFDYPEIEIRK